MLASVFVSHSVSEDEMPIVNRLASEFTGVGIQPYVAAYHREPGSDITAKVQSAISSSSAVVVVWTASGADSAWVNQEVGYALGRDLPVYALVEKDIEVKGMLHGVEYVELDRTNPGPALAHIARYVAHARTEGELAEARAKLAEAEESARQLELFAGAVVLVLILAVVILAARK